MANDSVRLVRASDAAPIARIYNHYVETSTITFEEAPVSADEMGRRIEAVAAASLPWVAAERDGALVGYAYATPWRARSAYRYSVEITVYVDRESGRQGHGLRLYSALFAALKEAGLHAAMGGIALPNPASIALHERMGMCKVAHFPQVGFKFGRWIDMGYWHTLL